MAREDTCGYCLRLLLSARGGIPAIDVLHVSRGREIKLLPGLEIPTSNGIVSIHLVVLMPKPCMGILVVLAS